MTAGALPKGYEFHEIEARSTEFWEQHDCFHADTASERPPFSIVIPPPNVTGQLHMGHALNNTLQDILSRYKRLKGFEVLWLPGMDHAGIATQNVVERQLAAEGLSRHDLGRAPFLARVWDWKEKYGGIILNQLKRLGSSCDWKRQRFTMDAGLSRAVRLVFVTLYQEDLIYRGERMINWCPRCMTALANIEVEAEELASKLYHLRYPLEDGSGDLVVATTRPETMLGDSAVAVHPEDPRYRDFIGKTVVLPLVGRRMPVIADPYVDRAFGTGALKITPAHDFNDFEIGRKHQLEFIRVIGEDGTMTAAAGRWAGLDRGECRTRIVDELEQTGFLIKVEDYANRVGHCYRCKSVVEPSLSLQWFIATTPLAEEAMRAVRDGRTRIIPKKWENDYFAWMENVEDWCISRQIWWGHRIPAWYCKGCGRTIVAMEDPERCPDCQGQQLEQDSDVLDTWFSSALWPFSTMGWPGRTRELEKFYPTSVLVTGFDILNFWVARMMMMGLHFMGEVPFRDVYVHALVRDAQGHKMSKSKGNVIDPLVMMDQYGTDALRFTLTAFAAQGRDIKLSEDRIEGYRHFVNKLWNATRLVLMNLDGTEPPRDLPARLDSLPHRWILSRLQRVIGEVDTALDGYFFNQYAQTLYQFIWHEYCDWYLEMIKPDFYGDDPDAKRLARGLAAKVLETVLVMLHPVMPFVTEEIYGKLPHTQGLIMAAGFPVIDSVRIDSAAEHDMALIMAVVGAVRNVRGEMDVPPAARVAAVVLCDRPADRDLLLEHSRTIGDLARLSSIQIGARGELAKPKLAAGALADGVEIFVDLEGILDLESETKRLLKEIGKLEKELGSTARKLENAGFLANAPAEVVAKEREKAGRLAEKRDKLTAQLERIRSLGGGAS